MSDRASAMMGGKGKGKSEHKHDGKVHKMVIKRAHGGGFIVGNHVGDPNDPNAQQTPPQDYAIADQDQLQQHVQDHMGDQPAAGAAPDPNAAAAAPAPAPAA